MISSTVMKQVRELLSEEDAALFEKHISFQKYDRGEVFYKEPDCDQVYFIECGEMRIFRTTEDGKEITLYRIGVGEICLLSLNGVISPLQFSSSAIFEQDTTLITLPVSIYNELFSKNALLQQYVLEKVMGTLNSVMTLSEEIAFHSVDKRVAGKLLELTTRQNSMVLKTTHEVIARELGSAREVVSRVLKNFTDQGIIKKTRGRLEIFDEKKLKKIASM